MNHDILLKLFADSLSAIEATLEGIPDSRLAEQPAGLRNHPAWTLTHLCVAHDLTLRCLASAPICPADWRRLAGPGSLPSPDRSTYPPLADLLETLRRQHTLITQGLRDVSPTHLEQPAPEHLRAFAPTLGHIVLYMLASHENYHLGQLQSWKRAAKLATD